jgi:hypothetical protein
LILADPQMLRERDFRVAKAIASKADLHEVVQMNLFDPSEALAYSKSDLERALRDLEESYYVLNFPATGDVIHDIYIRKVEKANGDLHNVEFARFEAVKDVRTVAR